MSELPEGRVVRDPSDYEGRMHDLLYYGDVYVRLPKLCPCGSPYCDHESEEA